MAVVTERVTVDPLTEDSSLASLDLAGLDASWGIYLLTHDYTPPDLDTIESGSADTEGDPVVQSRWKNRTIAARVRISEPGDPASTNLALNPVAALGATSWAGVSLVAGPTQVTPAAGNTPKGIGADTAISAQGNANADYVYHDTINVTNGVTYRASVYVQLSALTATGIRIVVYNAAGAVKKATGAVTYATVDATPDGWTRLDVSFKADATAAWRVGVEQVGAGGATWLTTGVLVEASATLGPYFDGQTPGCDWSGTRHGSTSTRPAPDGTRFSRIYRDLTRKIDRISREKAGTLRRIAATGPALTYDLYSAKITDAPQDLGIGRKYAEIGLSFEAKPAGRAPETQVGGNHDELTLPFNIFLATGIGGDMPALGRLVATDLQGQNQSAFWWGLQQRHYSASADAALYYEAESRTPQGSAFLSAGPTGASGAGSNTILQSNLSVLYQSMMSTQAAGGGNHMAHIGTYLVLVRTYRPTANTGSVSLMLEWAQGDFQHVTDNEADAVTFAADDREGGWVISELGLVTIEQPPSGTNPRWEGHLLGKSTVPGDDIYIDWIALIPVDEGSGKAVGSGSAGFANTYLGQDSFNQTAGALSGKTAPIGGNWSGAGDADDFQVVA